jgi:hypothetical protein
MVDAAMEREQLRKREAKEAEESAQAVLQSRADSMAALKAHLSQRKGQVARHKRG